MAKQRLSGTEKAALVLLALGEELAADIFKHLNEFEAKRLAQTLSRLGKVEPEAMQEALTAFEEALKQTNKTSLPEAAGFAQNVVRRAFKGDKGQSLAQEMMKGVAPEFKIAELIDGATLGTIISNEHPQTIAIIVAHLSPKKAAETVRSLPEALRPEIIIRIARLGPVAPEMLEEIVDFLRHEINALGHRGSQNVGGVDKVAALLGVLSQDQSTQLLDSLTERDVDLAETIKKAMFRFNDLMRINQKGMIALLRQVPQETWLKALRNASAALKKHIFDAMSERMAERLTDDLAALPPQPLREIEAAQGEILAKARALAEAGELEIMATDETYV